MLGGRGEWADFVCAMPATDREVVCVCVLHSTVVGSMRLLRIDCTRGQAAVR